MANSRVEREVLVNLIDVVRSWVGISSEHHGEPLMSAAIVVESVAKSYHIGHQHRHASYRTLRESLVSVARSLAERFGRRESGESADPFWALKEVSFRVGAGEVVGIVGRNGAGKSTLLKILSRITTPTSGRTVMHGRVGSLLEVGTGFHPELTGRENVYLNGAILGMRRREIDRKFDEIVAFAEVEKFLDTPVKRYSSGMYVRLAFAVAAHLEPEILIVDEVLAVGDVEFQRKCMGRMGEIARTGRTVLFVSHNLGAISELCTRCISLQRGTIVCDGDPQTIIRDMLERGTEHGAVDLSQWTTERSGPGPLRLRRVATSDALGNVRSHFAFGGTMVFEVELEGAPGDAFLLSIVIRNAFGVIVLQLSSQDARVETIVRGRATLARVRLDNICLNDGEYYVTLWLADPYDNLNDRAGNCLSFTVDSSNLGAAKNMGCVRVPSKWSVEAHS